MDGDPVLERLQRRKEFFEFAGDTMRDEAAFFLVLNPDQLSVNETGRAIEGSPSATCASVGSSRTSLPRSPTTTRRGRGATYLREEGRDRARPAPAGPRGVRAPARRRD